MAPKSVTPFLNGCSRTKNETISRHWLLCHAAAGNQRSRVAWQIARGLREALELTHLQRFQIENRLQRETANADNAVLRAAAAGGLQRLHRYLDELVFRAVQVEYDIAIHLAGQWQRELGAQTPPALLLLWLSPREPPTSSALTRGRENWPRPLASTCYPERYE